MIQSTRKKIGKGSAWWLLFGLGVWIVQQYLQLNPALAERVYSRGLFQGIRFMLDHTFGLLPFSSYYLFVLGLIGYLLGRVWRIYRYVHSWQGRLRQLVWGIAATTAGLYAIFQLLWGFNYLRPPLAELFEIQAMPLTEEQTFEELALLTGELEYARLQITQDTQAIDIPMQYDGLRRIIRSDMRSLLLAHQLPASKSLRSRLLLPKGILLSISTAGFYLPFTGACNIDAGLHSLQVPFVLAHEYGHGYGVGPEDACNFLAYAACSQSDNAYIRYAGLLGYWKYVAHAARKQSPQRYEKVKKHTSPGIRQDLTAIRKQMDRYPDLLPTLRDAAYDQYLKSQGVKEGIKNYNQVVMLAYAWRRR